MAKYYNHFSDNEAVIWIMEYAKKPKTEALQIVNGFRKSHRARGVADRMKIHAEELDPLRKEPCRLVSWLPVPFLDSVNKNAAEQVAVIAAFKAEANFPDWYEVSFGSVLHVPDLSMEHFNATGMDSFDGLAVRTDIYNKFGFRLMVGWEKGELYYSGGNYNWDEYRSPNLAVFPVGVIQALPIAELIPDGYEILDSGEQHKFEMKDLEYISFVEKGQSPVWGKTMRQRALDMGAGLGFADAKSAMVRSAEIPNEYRNKSILFPGTRLLSSSSAQVIPRIFRQDDGSWHLGSLTITSFWQHYDILVRLKQNPETT